MKLYFKIFIAIALFSSVLLGCKHKEEEPKKEEAKASAQEVKLSAESIKQINLVTETVTTQPLSGFITVPAKVMTNQDYEAQVGTLIQGRVSKVFVKIGDYVKAGQVMMTIEGFDIGVIKGEFLKAKAELDYTKTNYDRQKKLFDEKIGSQKAVMECFSLYQKALAEFKAEDNKIHSIGLVDDDILKTKPNEEHYYSNLAIKSPISGIVSERNVVIGQAVDVSINAFKVINTSSVWVDGQIYEKDLSKINHKTNATFVCSAYNNETFTGNITYIGQTVDEKTRTIMIRGDFTNKNNKLKPQMFGELRFPVGEGVQSILVPDEAVVKEANSQYVFVKTSDSTFIQRFVTSGVTYDGKIEIKEGLKVNEVIVTKGVFYLKSELKKSELEGD
jgi:membrane fusion protein, heavy metal efflux system